MPPQGHHHYHAVPHRQNLRNHPIRPPHGLDMIKLPGSENDAAEYIKRTILPNPYRTLFGPQYEETDPSISTAHLTTHHVTSAVALPKGHPVRCVLVQAVVNAFLCDDNHKFVREVQEIPEFVLDALRETKKALKSTARLGRSVSMNPPDHMPGFYTAPEAPETYTSWRYHTV
ncbi:hypothetical protein BO78DRAFT_424118 [Aspergillus sclerotiicarbonarius CBS 121057]|uniref:Uncharacterized protein n=1 Tax=Aspergillus sclerotiicarbonarius (strain CBS 121057 / IBT 28362) TaxID=1448318 RepID=A0A319DT21_ASPSB|nr:hypothetical protein BO78DRAFT_424118 [Aspergillus sclerotiicarbonarius CBS 121057]